MLLCTVVEFEVPTIGWKAIGQEKTITIRPGIQRPAVEKLIPAATVLIVSKKWYDTSRNDKGYSFVMIEEPS